MPEINHREEAKPPFFSSWSYIYLTVVLVLGLLILLFHLFGQHYQ